MNKGTTENGRNYKILKLAKESDRNIAQNAKMYDNIEDESWFVWLVG